MTILKINSSLLSDKDEGGQSGGGNTTNLVPMVLKKQRSLTPLLLLGYFLTIGVGCAQVYFLVKAVTGLSENSELSYFTSVIIAFFFFFFSVFFIGRYLMTMLFAFQEGSKKLIEKTVSETVAPLVTIIIPAWNEIDNIESTIASVFNINYPALEIIVVDDGSTDSTFQAAQDFVARQSASHPTTPIQVVTQENMGKASALNHGYRLASGDYILSMDADSELDPNSLKRLMARAQESGAEVVAGQVVIKNTRSMLSYLQQLEYVMMNGTSRMFQSFFSAVLVAPGPITLFSREGLDRSIKFREEMDPTNSETVTGPWETSTFAEDAKLSMTILASGGDCVFEPTAVCLTQAPAGLKGLLNQRYRWIRGNLQALKSTWELWTRAPSNRPGLGLWLMWFIIESVIWPLIDVFGAVIIVLVLVNTSAFTEGLLWYLALMSADVAAAMFAATACRTPRRLATLVPFYRMGYGLLLQGAALIAIIDETRRTKMTWS
jgi:biofilm PGA synthesis N-glycosyltransferase PgaC